MDARLKLLSYSSNLTLHSCPRKFQLYRLNASVETEEDKEQNVTFAFGHVVGEGIALVFEGLSEEAIIFKMFLGWHADLDDKIEKQKKSFYLAIVAVQKFISLREVGFLGEYELLVYKNKPATELSFRVHLPSDYKFRGSVDAVLRSKETGRIMVLECKTTSLASVNPATYKNSAQAIGYSVVLDVISPGLNSYDVTYLVYKTKEMDYELFSFPKSYLQRALWIQELLLDTETISLYDSTGVYPMRGESCMHFFRECEYLNLCTLSTKNLVKPCPPVDTLDTKVYDIELSIEDLIHTQVSLNTELTKEESILIDGDTLL